MVRSKASAALLRSYSAAELAVRIFAYAKTAAAQTLFHHDPEPALASLCASMAAIMFEGLVEKFSLMFSNAEKGYPHSH